MNNDSDHSGKSVLFCVLLILLAAIAFAFYLFHAPAKPRKQVVRSDKEFEETMQQSSKQTVHKNTSKKKIECHKCNDTGWIPCTECEETGVCPICEGKGLITEDSYVATKHGSRRSDGTRMKRDDDSGGGYIKRAKKLCPRTCQACRGKGWKACDSCKNPKKQKVPPRKKKDSEDNSGINGVHF